MGLINLIKLVLIGLAIWFLYRSVTRFLANKTAAKRAFEKKPESPEVLDVMVEDPQCGTYLPKQEAIKAWTKDGERYFCSKECRDKYLAGEGK